MKRKYCRGEKDEKAADGKRKDKKEKIITEILKRNRKKST
jgi:hypothetical protein